MPFSIQRNDITHLQVDAIVNAANIALAPGGGVCGAIFAAAGYDRMVEACRALGSCPTGRAVITPGFALPARYVIHAVGPVWRGGGQNEAELLRGAYLSAMTLAEEHECHSIAFPLISSGIYGYPKAEAFAIAVGAIRDFLREHDMEVILTVFDRPSLLLGQRYRDVESFIDDNYVDASPFRRRRPEERSGARPLAAREMDFAEEAFSAPCAQVPPPARRSLKDLVNRLDESFNTMLLRLIDEKGFSDVEVYKRANLDRKHFSKLRKQGYNPSKPTAVALAIALRLNLDETRDLLGRAGYTLTHASRFDVIIEYCIQEKIYDIFEVNELLFAFGEKLLG